MFNKYAKKTDANQPQIVKDLRDAGVQVIITNFGADFPDLLCGFKGQWVLIEVKTPTTQLKRGQMEFLSNATGYVGLATTFDEAFNIATNPEHYGLSQKEKDLIAGYLETSTQEQMAIKKFTRKVLKIRIEKK